MSDMTFEDSGVDDQKVRRVLARDAIRAGRMPGRNPDHVQNGQSAKGRCTVCLLPVGAQTLGFRLEFGEGDGIPATHVLHVPCFAAWEAECKNGHDQRRPEDERHYGPADRSGHAGGPEGSR